MILDEPTSHLDIDSREALIHALNDFSGAVLLITHDVYLAEAVADRLWLVHGGRARQYDGDLSDYRKLVLAADRPREASAETQRPERAETAAPIRRPALAPLKKRLETAEKTIRDIQNRIAMIEVSLSDPKLFASDSDRAIALTAERERLALSLSAAEEEWLAAGAALEEAAG